MIHYAEISRVVSLEKKNAESRNLLLLFGYKCKVLMRTGNIVFLFGATTGIRQLVFQLSLITAAESETKVIHP